MTEEEAKTKWTVTGKRLGHSKGYVRLLCKNHPNSHKDGYIYENIYIGSLALGRGLKANETVHHINGDTSDNSNGNLLICTNKYHQQLHARLEKSSSWPQFTSKKINNRPQCKSDGCNKYIPYQSATGFCVAHYWEDYRNG